MYLIVRLECQKCCSHRDFDFGHLEDSDLGGIVMKIRWRAAEVGWRIHFTNAKKETLCPRCSTQASRT